MLVFIECVLIPNYQDLQIILEEVVRRGEKEGGSKARERMSKERE